MSVANVYDRMPKMCVWGPELSGWSVLVAAGFMKTALTLLCVLQMEKKSCALFVLFSLSTVGAICMSVCLTVNDNSIINDKN